MTKYVFKGKLCLNIFYLNQIELRGIQITEKEVAMIKSEIN